MMATLAGVFGEALDLRVDINGAWDHPLAAAHIPLFLRHHVRIVEQPMMPGDPGFSDFCRLMRRSGIDLMADESACCLADADAIIASGDYRIVNIRLSKCGGFRRSLEMIGRLRRAGLHFQIGCQLGESALLSAAGRTLALLCGDALYCDGSYDQFLLKTNITDAPVSFGRNGRAGPLPGPGLGVRVNRQLLERLSGAKPPVALVNPHH